jgi:hypothetical protein
VPSSNGLQGRGKPGDVDAEIGRTLAVDGHGELRLVGLVVEPHILEPPAVFDLATSSAAAWAELGMVVADERHLQAIAGAADAEAVRLDGEAASDGTSAPPC